MTVQLGKIVVLLESKDIEFQQASYELTPQSSQQEIVDALQSNLLERGFNLQLALEDGSFIMRPPAENSSDIFFIPKSTAGLTNEQKML